MMILSWRFIKTDGATRPERRRLQSEAAHALLNELLDRCGIAERDVERDENGRPYIVGRSDVDFNISHSDDIAVCALSVGEGRVGVDVERKELSLPQKHLERFGRRFFSAAPVEGSDLSRAWTEKEAYLKYLGTGLTVDLKSVEPSDDDSIRMETVLVGDYLISVCLEKNALLRVDSPVSPERVSPAEGE